MGESFRDLTARVGRFYHDSTVADQGPGDQILEGVRMAAGGGGWEGKRKQDWSVYYLWGT